MDVDYRLAFDLAPVGLVLSRNRLIVDCNQQLCEMFGADARAARRPVVRAALPDADEFERIGARMAPILERQRPLRRRPHHEARSNGEVFWCHVTGRALNRDAAARSRHLELRGPVGSQRPVKAELTAREREVAALLIDGLTSKEIGKRLAISHRTVEIYRARLMRKYGASPRPSWCTSC